MHSLKPLLPKLLVSYKRYYFINKNQVRITLDTDLTYTRIHSGIYQINKAKELTRDLCILEIKVNNKDALVTNNQVNQFLKMFKFRISKFSKYCDAVECLRLIDI